MSMNLIQSRATSQAKEKPQQNKFMAKAKRSLGDIFRVTYFSFLLTFVIFAYEYLCLFFSLKLEYHVTKRMELLQTRRKVR